MKKSVSGKKTAAKRTGRSRGSAVQGEGNYEAARRYRHGVETFVRTADVPRAARAAAPKNAREAHEMSRAEAVGRSHARRDPKDRVR
jgi:hypothetical protein